MKIILDEINKILAEKLSNEILVKDKDFESIYVKTIMKYNHKATDLELGFTKKGKFRAAYVWGKVEAVSPFMFVLQKTKRRFDGRDQFSITGCIIEDLEVQDCANKEFSAILKEANMILDEKVFDYNEEKKHLEKTFKETLSLHNMDNDTFQSLKNLEKQIKEL